ncbi:MAG: DNA gyrase/topoisomerase IV subunit B [Christensenellales bacterium]
MGAKYSAEDIQVLEGLEAVRLRPGMYIGTTGAKGLHHILWEIVDNGIDELANGYGDTLRVTLNADNSVSVEDNGRGIPIDIHPTLKISGVEVVFTQLHAGAKFNSETYSYSGGLHGVGASVTNALSEWLNVEIFTRNKVYYIEFYSPEVNGKILSGIVKKPLSETGRKTEKTGTRVTFMPDRRVFGREKYSFQTISTRLQELAFLNGGIKIILEDLRSEGEPAREEYHYKGGLTDYVRHLNESKLSLYTQPVFAEDREDTYYVAYAIQHTDSYSESIFSYVNNIPTTEGGTHETGFKSALTKVMNDFARKRGLLKEKDENLLGEDFREGITVVLAVKMRNVQFEGQTKTKLGNPDARMVVEQIVINTLTKYFNDKKNIKTGETVIAKAIEAAKVRTATKKAKELARKKNSATSGNLVGKLSACTGRKAELNELFIVEGDSAGGSAKQGRDRSFQAILPLRGKPINAEKKRIELLLKNEEICTIINAIGAGFEDDFEINQLKYHKIIILADADQDGAHIRAILLTFFYRYMKELIINGHLYIGMPPLYKVEKKGFIKYAYNDNDLADIVEEAGRGYKIQRYKGLGEMNPEQLWDTTMNPKTRMLTRVTIDDAANAERVISTLMGDNVESRKKYIYKYANFNKVDDFEKIGV